MDQDLRKHPQLPGIEMFVDNGFCKIVQIGVGGIDYLLFGNEESFHTIILESFLKSRSLPFCFADTLEEPIVDLSSSEGLWTVYGMGKPIIRPNSGLIYFTGDSLDYKIGIDKNHIERMKPILASVGYNDVSCSSR